MQVGSEKATARLLTAYGSLAGQWGTRQSGSKGSRSALRLSLPRPRELEENAIQTVRGRGRSSPLPLGGLSSDGRENARRRPCACEGLDGLDGLGPRSSARNGAPDPKAGMSRGRWSSPREKDVAATSHAKCRRSLGAAGDSAGKRSDSISSHAE